MTLPAAVAIAEEITNDAVAIRGYVRARWYRRVRELRAALCIPTNRPGHQPALTVAQDESETRAAQDPGTPHFEVCPTTTLTGDAAIGAALR